MTRLLGVSPNTEREYRIAVGKAGLLEGLADELPALDAFEATLPRALPPQRVSAVEKWTTEVKRLREKESEARAIHDHLHRD